MKLHYMGKFNLDPNTLPQAEHKPGATEFKEADSMKKLAVIANAVSFVIFAVLAVAAYLRLPDTPVNTTSLSLGIVRFTFFRLFSLAPFMVMYCCMILSSLYCLCMRRPSFAPRPSVRPYGGQPRASARNELASAPP